MSACGRFGVCTAVWAMPIVHVGSFGQVVFAWFILNGMMLLNVSDYCHYMMRGGIILGAVLSNQMLERIR